MLQPSSSATNAVGQWPIWASLPLPLLPSPFHIPETRIVRPSVPRAAAILPTPKQATHSLTRSALWKCAFDDDDDDVSEVNGERREGGREQSSASAGSAAHNDNCIEVASKACRARRAGRPRPPPAQRTAIKRAPSALPYLKKKKILYAY